MTAIKQQAGTESSDSEFRLAHTVDLPWTMQTARGTALVMNKQLRKSSFSPFSVPWHGMNIQSSESLPAWHYMPGSKFMPSLISDVPINVVFTHSFWGHFKICSLHFLSLLATCHLFQLFWSHILPSVCLTKKCSLFEKYSIGHRFLTHTLLPILTGLNSPFAQGNRMMCWGWEILSCNPTLSWLMAKSVELLWNLSRNKYLTVLFDWGFYHFNGVIRRDFPCDFFAC